MNDFLQRLKQRKLVQWSIGYIAAAFSLIQGTDVVASQFGWPESLRRGITLALTVGFFVMLVIAWVHGERGAQRVSRLEVLLIVLVLEVGGVAIWHYEQPPASAKVAAAKHASREHAAQAIPAKSVAVLPFENLSDEKGNAYFADGMQDLILTKLADIGDLKVIARTSTQQYASHPDDLKTIGRQLGVATILEGSVQKAGNQVLINVQLIDARTDAHIWAQDYPRTLDNIFGVEGEVAQKVAEALQAKLSPAESRAVASIPTTNAQAYTAYLKAQYEFGQFSNGDGEPDHLRKAAQYFKQAIADDPQFALAWAGLSIADDTLLANGFASDDALRNDSVDAARKVLALQPDLSQAHLALGLAMYFLHAGSADDAIRELQTAARLAPSASTPHTVLAIIYAERGDWTQATAQIAQAVQVDPQNSFSYDWSAGIDAAIGNYTAERQMLERCLAIKPGDMECRDNLGRNFVRAQGDLQAARVQFAQLPDRTPFNKYGDLAYTWWLARDYARALDAASRMPQAEFGTSAIGDVGTRELAIGQMALAAGDQARGRASLEQARTEVLAALKAHPDQDALQITLSRIEMWSGHRDAAMQASAKASSLAASSAQRALDTSIAMANQAQVMAHFGDAAGATAILRKLLATLGNGQAISPALLRLDPVWDPIRNDPRFVALLKKYAQYKPAVTYDAAPAASASSTP